MSVPDKYWMRIKEIFETSNLSEINIDEPYNTDELTVKQKFIDYFTKKGYKGIGEGRDQLAFLTPRQTVLKILGLGEEQRQRAVEDYVNFFEQHQNNPYYPKIFNSQRFDFEGDSYFLYETEYLLSLPNDEEILDWLETYMNLLSRGSPEETQEFVDEGLPAGLTEKDVSGITAATKEIMDKLSGYQLDLSNIENIRRRKNGHLVIIDPVSMD